MNVDLKKLTMNTLETLCQQNITAMFHEQCKATPDVVKMGKIEDFVGKLTAEIQEREAKVIETKPKDTGSPEYSNSGAQHVANRDFTSHKIKNMGTTVSNEIPVFSTGHNVHIWLTKLESYHKLFVIPDSSGVMEEHFLQVAKSRLCPEYLNAMMASSEDTTTYDGMKDYMKKHHASKISVFQILDTIWDMDKTDSDKTDSLTGCPVKILRIKLKSLKLKSLFIGHYQLQLMLKLTGNQAILFSMAQAMSSPAS